jgi:uncharacterized membrane protein
MVQDKLRHFAHTSQDFVRKSTLDVGHRARGLAAKTRSQLGRDEPSDEVLIDRIRSEMGRVVSHPRAIEVRAENGCVCLYGDVLTHEADELIRRIERVRGVHELDDQLQRLAAPGDVPSLQGGRLRRSRQIEQETWPPRLRLGAGALGASAAALGLASGGLAGIALGGTGLIVLLRATTDLPLRRIFGIGAKRRAIDVLKHINIDRPIEEVFAFFQNFENFPRFMSHLKSVSVSNGRSHWVLDGPAHLELSWDAETVSIDPNRSISWRSIPGSAIQSGGIVRFEEDGTDRTRLEVRMSYNPPGGAIGHAMAKLFGADPKRMLNDDLVRLKSLLERGRATGREQQVTKDELLRQTPTDDAG